MISGTYKIISVGQASVGKTSLARRFAFDEYSESYIPTLGVTWFTRSIVIPKDRLNEAALSPYSEAVSVRCSLWDTGGQELFSFIRPRYYMGAHASLVVFDITRRETFDNLDQWVKEIRDRCGDIAMIIVGNKIDKISERAVERSEGEAYAERTGVGYREASAASAENVYDLFEELARDAVVHSDTNV